MKKLWLLLLLFLAGCSSSTSENVSTIRYEVLSVEPVYGYDTNYFGHKINERVEHIVTYVDGSKIKQIEVSFGEYGLNRLRLSETGESYMMVEDKLFDTYRTVYVPKEMFANLSE